MIRYLLIFLILPSVSIAQESTFCKQLTKVNELINLLHVDPKPLSDSVETDVLERLTEQFNDSHLFFLEQDYSKLLKVHTNLKKAIAENNCSFINEYISVFEQSIQRSKDLIEELKDEDFNYTGKDRYTYSASKSDIIYHKNEDALNEYWKTHIRVEIINRIIDLDSSESYVEKNFKTLEADIKNKVLDNELCAISQISNRPGGLKTYIEEQFLDVLVKIQDPNSSFFNPSEKIEFERSIANSESTFGIITSKIASGAIIIEQIIPGSSAFKNGMITAEDKIIDIQIGDTSIDLTCIANETVMDILSNPKYSAATFRIKKENGSLESVSLIKSKVSIDNNTLDGFILKQDHTFGYIKIPAFYTDVDTFSGNGVANDLANELYKLKKETIEGLILDLRFNGGGSMQEAIKLAGLFIDRGPVGISSDKTKKSFTIRDPQRGTVFSKPIIILINEFSASASEFFANVMQDYNVAVLVGQTSFGKGSSQIIVPLDKNERDGFIKLTTGLFFSVDGSSHQQLGVTPDIEMPSLYSGFEIGERFKTGYLKNSKTEVVLEHQPKPKMPYLNTIISHSLDRIQSNKIFEDIKKINELMRTNIIFRNIDLPLSYKAIKNDVDHRNTLFRQFSEFNADVKTTLNIKNTKSTMEVLSYNTDLKLANKKLIEKLSKDPIIEEASFILNDILQNKN